MFMKEDDNGDIDDGIFTITCRYIYSCTIRKDCLSVMKQDKTTIPKTQKPKNLKITILLS